MPVGSSWSLGSEATDDDLKTKLKKRPLRIFWNARGHLDHQRFYITFFREASNNGTIQTRISF